MSLKTKAAKIFRETLTLISPELNTRVCYRVKFHKSLDFKNPQTLSEKVLWLKINNYREDPLVNQCADKYRVREFIKKKGCSDILVPLIGVYEHPEDIPWSDLPQQFVIKLNVGCGKNIIVTDITTFDCNAAVKKLNHWMKEKQWLGYAEMQYKDVKPYFLVEKYIGSEDGTPPVDYKIYCMNGKPMAILYIEGRFSDMVHASFFDLDWNVLGINKKKYVPIDPTCAPPKPQSLARMVEAATVLSERFPFVRVDFYDVDGQAMFGEMTFTPAGGFGMAEVDINGKSMGAYLTVT